MVKREAEEKPEEETRRAEVDEAIEEGMEGCCCCCCCEDGVKELLLWPRLFW